MTFDRLTADLRALLDHLNVQEAVVLIGVSGGTGVATHFALQHPERLAGLILIHPLYGGEERGFSSHQQAVFAWMDAMASQALVKGVEVLKPLYANVPSEYREQAIEMAMGFDAASVVATSQLLASGSQPFKSVSQLNQLDVQTLIVKGADEMHPAAVADEYLKNLPHVRGIDQSDPALMSRLQGFCRDCLPARG